MNDDLRLSLRLTKCDLMINTISTPTVSDYVPSARRCTVKRSDATTA